MAVRATAVRTLLDVTRTLNPDGTQAKIAEVLNKKLEILDDIPWFEGNLLTGNRHTERTSLPGVGYRRLNEGVPRSKSTSRSIDEAAALLEANAQVDRKIAILSGDPGATRVKENQAFIEAMGQQFSSTLMFGNSTIAPREMTGFTPRFNLKSGPTGKQIIDCGGTGTDNFSIWLIGWGEGKVYGIYPKGTKAGLMHMDTTSNLRRAEDGYAIGDEAFDANGNPYLVYKDHFEWEHGLAIEDPRYVVRAANIDKSLLTADASTGADIQDIMVQMLELIEGETEGMAFYVPRAVRSMLRRQLLNTKNSQLSWEEMAGRKVMFFGEAPIRRLDTLNLDEARVV